MKWNKQYRVGASELFIKYSRYICDRNNKWVLTWNFFWFKSIWKRSDRFSATNTFPAKFINIYITKTSQAELSQLIKSMWSGQMQTSLINIGMHYVIRLVGKIIMHYHKPFEWLWKTVKLYKTSGDIEDIIDNKRRTISWGRISFLLIITDLKPATRPTVLTDL